MTIKWMTGTRNLKPEIAHTLFLPIIKTLTESAVPPTEWQHLHDPQDATPLDQMKWIDEGSFNQLLTILVSNCGKGKLIQIGKQIVNDESIGMGDLLLPFVDSPYDLFQALAKEINSRARTLHLSIEKVEDREYLLTLTAMQRPNNGMFCLWLEGMLSAINGHPFMLECRKTSCMSLNVANERHLHLCEREETQQEIVPGKGCSYHIVWKKSSLFSRRQNNNERFKRARASIGRARSIITAQAAELESLRNRMAQQDLLLKGIVSLSQVSKSVRSFSELVNMTATRICSDFGFDRSQIYLAHEEKLEIAAVIDPADPNWAQQVYAVCQSNPIRLDGRTEESRAFQKAKAVLVNNPWGNMFVPQAQLQAWKSKAYLIVPMRGADRMIGILLADHYYKRRTITEEDVDKLTTVANIAGLAIDKLRLIDRLEGKVAERTVELQRANRKLRDLYEKARESDRMKSEFLANMSHELRTPLNSIIGFSKLILKGIDGPLTENQNTDLEAILNSGTHLLGLINDILDLSKIESGKMELNKEEFEMSHLLEQVLATGEGLVRDKPVHIVANTDPDMPLVYGDKMRLKQVMLNLVSNAVKFTQQGVITINTKAGDRELYVAVTDTGMGMPQEKIDSAFEQFRQLDSGTARQQGGSGLGLTISKRFVEMHGGRIWVSSTEGVGSTFHFTIPLAKTDERKTIKKADSQE